MRRFDWIVLGIIVALIAAIAGIAAGGDQAGAGIIGLEPADGSRPATATSIRITFSQPMDVASVAARFTIQPDLPGDSHWEGNTFVFQPRQRLQPDTTYVAQLGAVAMSSLGRPTKDAVIWSFQPRLADILYLHPADQGVTSLWIVSSSRDNPHSIFTNPLGVDSFSPSPDGSNVVVAVNETQQAAELIVIDRDGKNPRRISNCAPARCGRPAWSPDGRTIAYERHDLTMSGEGAVGRIWLYDVGTGGNTPLFQDTQQGGFDIVWSPDSRSLAFFDPDRAAIRVVEIKTGRVASLPSQMGQTGTFSPDGLAMAFTDIRPVGGQFFAALWLGKIQPGGEATPLIDDAEEDQYSAWSPDGETIAFGRRALDRRDGMGTRLALLDVASRAVVEITSDRQYNDSGFHWNPDGDAILMQRFRLGGTDSAPELWIYWLATQELAQVADNGLDGQWIP